MKIYDERNSYNSHDKFRSMLQDFVTNGNICTALVNLSGMGIMYISTCDEYEKVRNLDLLNYSFVRHHYTLYYIPNTRLLSLDDTIILILLEEYNYMTDYSHIPYMSKDFV